MSFSGSSDGFLTLVLCCSRGYRFRLIALISSRAHYSLKRCNRFSVNGGQLGNYRGRGSSRLSSDQPE